MRNIFDFLGSLRKPSGGSGTRVRVLAETLIDNGTNNKYVSWAQGSSVPVDGEAGFAKGCRFILTSGSAGTTEYVNEGSHTSCDFNVVRTSAESGSLQFVEVTLTNAQIKALRASPVSLVPAPGANKAVVFQRAYLMLDAGSNALTETADNLAIRYTDGSGVIVSDVETTGFIDQTSDTATNANAKVDAIVAVSGQANQAIVLHNSGDGEFGGNAANDATMRVKVWYYVVSTL